MNRNIRVFKNLNPLCKCSIPGNKYLSSTCTQILKLCTQSMQTQPLSSLKLVSAKRRFQTSLNNLKEENSESGKEEPAITQPKKKAGQLAKVFAEYGTTAVAFHTTISLTSLGICYMAVSSGVDVVALLQKVNLISESTAESKLASGAGTFVVAYACHKVFMPLRAFMTVSCTPIIVKRLRNMGFLKNAKPKL